MTHLTVDLPLQASDLIPHPARQRVVVFLGVLLVLTAVAHVIAARVRGSNLASLIIMWSPGFAAIVASIVTRRSLGAIGCRPWPVKWLAGAWALPLLYALPAYALVWATGLGDVPSPTFLARSRITLGMAATEPDWFVIARAFVRISIINLPPAMVLALGEEIGWRGYLVPELTKWVGLRRAAWMSGAIWGAWHLPGILFGGYHATGTPMAYQLACFAILVVATGIVMAWLRMTSGSVWPAVILHATHNGLVQAFFNRITIDTGPTRYFIGEFGIAMAPFLCLLAWSCLRRTGETDRLTG